MIIYRALVFYSKTNTRLDAFQSHSQKTIFFANTKNVIIINDENVAVFFRVFVFVSKKLPSFIFTLGHVEFFSQCWGRIAFHFVH